MTDRQPKLIVPLQQLHDRVDQAIEDSDTSAFVSLLLQGEGLLKLVVAGLVSLMDPEPSGQRYRLEHQLVRADSPGAWVATLDDIAIGPANSAVSAAGRDFVQQLTERISHNTDDWRMRSVDSLLQACNQIDEALAQQVPTKLALRHWFLLFSRLRNRTRGHGSFTDDKATHAAPFLRDSIELIAHHCDLLQAEWGYVKQRLSGAYRVVPLGDDAPRLSRFFSGCLESYPDGVYIQATPPAFVSLITSDSGLTDFFYPNGGYRADKYEVLSYLTDEVRLVDGGSYAISPALLPGSETEGAPNLNVVGNSFTNIPDVPAGYVERKLLQQELRGILLDSRNPVITLVGRGGIGKTSLALDVLHKIAADGPYLSILWLSARDIDLLPEGPKSVLPKVTELRGIADLCAYLLNPARRNSKGFDSASYLKALLLGDEGGPHLLVIDNFETVTNPLEVYNSLNNCVRLPNKVFITSRYRDFHGDEPIGVSGMEKDEFNELVSSTAMRLGVIGRVDADFTADLYEQSEGHPYVAKVILGELSRTKGAKTVAPLMARREDILDALFERTYMNLLSPPERRVFLTLCSWKSTVPALALEAALLRPGNAQIDVKEAIERLKACSLVEASVDATTDEDILTVPVTAQVFGRQKLIASPLRIAVEADGQILQMFGAAQGSDRRGVRWRVERFFREIGERVTASAESWVAYEPLMQFVARRFPEAWLLLGRLQQERGIGTSSDRARFAAESIRHYLEVYSEDAAAWNMLARISREALDPLGEITALIQRATLHGADIRDALYAAQRLMIRLQNGEITIELEERRHMVEKLLLIIESSVAVVDPDEISRIAWLYLHLQDSAKARQYVEMGLALAPDNVHLIRLKNRLSPPVA